MARIVTDYVIFAHLTDVYVESDYQGIGLENWLIQCCNEIIEEIPALRYVILRAGESTSGGTARLYEQEMGMSLFEQGESGLFVMQRKHSGN